MFELLVVLLLRVKGHLLGALPALTAAKIPLIATLLVVGTTGFTVTGQIQADEDGTSRLVLVAAPLESKTCVDALIAQTTALLEIDLLAADARAQLRRMRDAAFDTASAQDKTLDATAARAAFDASWARIADDLSATRARLLAAADLGNCQDQKAETGIVLDVADLRARYDRIVREFGARLNGVLDDTQARFDALVASAQQKPKATPTPTQQQRGASASHSRD